MRLPMKYLIVPVSEASKSIEKYKKAKSYEEKMALVKLIAINIRQAETTYFDTWSKSILFFNKDRIPNIFPCKECFKKTMSANSLREHISEPILILRKNVNYEIIHATENGYTFTLNFDLVEQYYNEFIDLPLFNFPEVKSLPIKFCKEHYERSKESRKK